MRPPAPPYVGEGPNALWHVSENRAIDRFEPHRAATSTREGLLVWAIDTRHLPHYWFPRDCPRGTWWAGPDTNAADAAALLPDTDRVHAIQADWLTAMQQARVVAYRLPSETFEPDPEVGGYWISTETVKPLDVVVLDDLVGRHERAGIELRIVPDLAALWQQVIASTVEFSGMRLRNLGSSSDGETGSKLLRSTDDATEPAQ